MGFNERIGLAEKMDIELSNFLNKNKFQLEKTGYENYISKEARTVLRQIHDDSTVRFLRYMPDYFCIYKNKNFFIELKVMDSPILLDSRVNELKQRTKLDDLSKQNIGVVETAAIVNYENLSKIDVKILIIVYCTFHPKKLLIDWETNIHKFFNDKVRLGQGNASFTPFTNIHLDKMRDFNEFFKTEFGIELKDETITELIKSIEKN